MQWLMAVGVGVLVSLGVLVAAGYLATMGVVGRHIAPKFTALPADYGLKDEVVSFRSVDGVNLKGWWIPAQGLPRGTVILAHGNGGNRSSMLSRAVFLAANGYNAFPIDLRAHGESAGNYMTTGYLEALDILGAVEAAKQRAEKGPFVAFGHSYGARASLWAAAGSSDTSAVIADCAFVSIYDALKRETARVVNDPNASFGQKAGLRMVNVLAEQRSARKFTEWAYYLRTGFRYEQYDDAMNAVSLIKEKPILFFAGRKTKPPRLRTHSGCTMRHKAQRKPSLLFPVPTTIPPLMLTLLSIRQRCSPSLKPLFRGEQAFLSHSRD